MRHTLPLTLSLAGLTTSLGCLAVTRHGHVRIIPPPPVVVAAIALAALAPPPARVEVVPAPPSDVHIWIAGRWAWQGRDYIWVPGHYERRPRPRSVWVDGRWHREPGGWRWEEGYWR